MSTRDAKRMFKVIVAGGISLVSVGSLVALGACGSDTSSTGGSSGMPHEGALPSDGGGPITRPSDSGSDTGGDAQEPYDAGDDADASFPPII